MCCGTRRTDNRSTTFKAGFVVLVLFGSVSIAVMFKLLDVD